MAKIKIAAYFKYGRARLCSGIKAIGSLS